MTTAATSTISLPSNHMRQQAQLQLAAHTQEFLLPSPSSFLG
jgi:hypothetical protein